MRMNVRTAVARELWYVYRCRLNCHTPSYTPSTSPSTCLVLLSRRPESWELPPWIFLISDGVSYVAAVSTDSWCLVKIVRAWFHQGENEWCEHSFPHWARLPLYSHRFEASSSSCTLTNSNPSFASQTSDPKLFALSFMEWNHDKLGLKLDFPGDHGRSNGEIRRGVPGGTHRFRIMGI